MHDERRDRAWHQADLQLYIRYGKRRFLGARVYDLSVGGIFLKVHALTLPVGTPVELEFQGFGKNWLIPALVSHRNQDGIGMTFREPQVELFQDSIQHSIDLPASVARVDVARAHTNQQDD